MILSVGDIRSQIAAEWLQIAQRSQWRAYRKLPSLFLMVSALPLYYLPFLPKWGFHMPVVIYANGHISATGDPIHFMFGSRVGFSGTADLMAIFPVRTNPRWRPPPSWKKFKWPYLRNSSRSIYIARIARSSLRQHNFLVVNIMALYKSSV